MNSHYPKIMGILNCTPDSFSDGGLYMDVDAAVIRAGEMISQGASIIDIGGESTRPGSDPVPVAQEMQRTIPVLEKCIARWPEIAFSIDTTKFEVAEAALQTGAHYVNDVSGLRKEPRFIDLCIKYNAGLMIMHSIGNPKTMQENPVYDNVVEEVRHELVSKADEARARGVKEVVIDPGIGFGKTLKHNIALIKSISRFCDTGYPVLIGASRKSMIGNMLNGRPAEDRLAGTLAVHYHALLSGAHILRVHDVQEAHDTLLVYRHLGRLQG